MAEEILAERVLDGYPGAKVQLHVDLSTRPVLARVFVVDGLGATELPADGYFHPFAYGYVYPPDREGR